MTQTIPHPSAAVLADFLGGLLEGQNTYAVERHVDNCDACLEVMRWLPDGPLALLTRAAVRHVSVSDHTPFPGMPRVDLPAPSGVGLSPGPGRNAGA